MTPLLPFLEGRAQPRGRTGRAALRLLATVGLLYGALQRLRAEMYRRHFLPSYRPPCPVISVGNLSSGGTGKTPTVLWLAQQLLARRQASHGKGGRLAIVSRGYGASSNRDNSGQEGVTIVADLEGLRLAPPQAADEAVLLARNLPGVVVLTGPDRSRLIRFAVKRYGSELILMDDGFQHLRVQRDLDIVLIDAQRPFGNGHVLPGGILRERPAALRRCDIILVTRADNHIAAHKTTRVLTQAVPNKPLFYAEHQPQAWGQLGSEQILPLAALQQTPVLAFCGIARPDSFAQSLTTLKIPMSGLHAFPDHFNYSQKALHDLIHKARVAQAQALVCTEKDAVKIEAAWLGTELGEFPLFYLRMALAFPHNPTWVEHSFAKLGI